MKVIKLYAWEAAFEEKIEKLRKEEVRRICFTTSSFEFDTSDDAALILFFKNVQVNLNRRGNLILRASDLINMAAPFVVNFLIKFLRIRWCPKYAAFLQLSCFQYSFA